MSETRRPSVAGRAVLALLLMIGFYAMALGIAGGLLYIPYALYKNSKRVNGKLAVACVVTSGLILWSVAPRPDTFTPPGPRLDRRRHPRLFAVLEEIAASTGQQMPVEVYLDPDVNAWVSQRGGLMGFGSRQIMAVGLPLLRILTVSQFRGVVTHEFGHYHGGDTKLGPWIYKTHAAIFRTLETLGESDNWMRYPFIGYAKVFLRVSNAISRRQEFAADELAARLVGSKAFSDGLKAVHQAGIAYSPFLQNEVLPVLNSGFRPPVAEGFRRFLQAKGVSTIVAQHIEQELRSPVRDPYQTHPPMAERLQAVESFPAGEAPVPDPPAIELLENVEAVEAELLVAMTGNESIRKLKTIAWDQVGAQVWTPAWKERLKGKKAVFAGLTPASFPDLVPRLAEIGKKLAPEPLPADDLKSLAAASLGWALALALLERGWTMEAEPGAEIVLRHAGQTVEPFSALPRLADRKLSAEAWRSRCTELSIADLDLAPPA